MLPWSYFCEGCSEGKEIDCLFTSSTGRWQKNTLIEEDWHLRILTEPPSSAMAEYSVNFEESNGLYDSDGHIEGPVSINM